MASHPSKRASSGARVPITLPPRKPMRSARRVSLFEREIRVQLSASAIDVLMSSASVLSEGEVMDGIFGGSTMLTIDLTRASARLSEACDAATAQALEVLLAEDPRVAERARAIAIAEAESSVGGALDEVGIELRIRRDGRHFHIDMDIEAIPREAL